MKERLTHRVYVVSGSRDFPDAEFVRLVANSYVQPWDTLIHGDARGVDRLCGDVAVKKSANVIKFHANWEEEGKAAGVIRNKRMIEYVALEADKGADVMALIFWDGVSKGTLHFLCTIRKYDIPYKLITLEIKKKEST